MRISVRRPTTRLGALVAALALTIGVQGAAVLAGASPANAAAVTGIHKVTGRVSPTNSQLSKRVRADCPAGERVIGGGGWVQDDTTADAAKVALVELQPVHPASGVDSYFVTAQEVGTNVKSNWWVQAYAICASPVPGMHIVTAASGVFNNTVAEAQCAAGEDPLGGGGKVNNPANHVSLASEDVFLATHGMFVLGAPDTAAFSGTWSMTSYAVCAPTPPGYQVVGAFSTGGATDTTKVAFVSCPAGTRVYSANMRNDGPTFVGKAMQVVYPFNSLDQVEAVVVDTQASGVASFPIVAQAICAA